MANNNPNPVIERIVLKIDCYLKTPALIGSGLGEYTDSDVLRDADGEPFLPGSTVAGVMRSLFPEDVTLFGGQDSISPLWVMDTKFEGANIIELDGVAIDRENKVAIDSKKYDFEAVDAGATFTIRLMLVIREEDKCINGQSKNYKSLLKKLIGLVQSGRMAVGAKTKRGFGCVAYICAKQQVFKLTKGNIAALDAWVKFDWDSPNGWEEAEREDYNDGYSVMSAELKLDGSIMIRDTRHIYDNLGEEEKAPDYKHITVNGEPVILGTSWAGAFRSGLQKLLEPKFPGKACTYLDKVFGCVKEADSDEGITASATVSQIVFGASFFKKAEDEKTVGFRSIARVKIDRFTGGASDGALFVEKPWYGGETEVEIRFPKGCLAIEQLLLLGFDAINKGLIQIGGEASIGRGFFKDVCVRVDGVKTETGGDKTKLLKRLEEEGDAV
ncbi:MAG: RAMP superfamily CRISPR-associated protein [Clostridiales bacterium]|nr:RAMP superfamily CRISPR-associated protein [Clostridiales bacterium]